LCSDITVLKIHCLLLFALVLAISSAGCASNGVLVSAQRNAQFSPTPADTIVMALRPNPSAEDAALGTALLAELAREDFNIVTNVDAAYTLTYLVEDDSTERTYFHPEVYQRPPPQTTGDILATEMGNPGRLAPQNTVIVPTTLVFRARGIRLYLYANPKRHPGGLQVAWTGCIESGRTIPTNREPLLIKTLLGYFGQDYLGRVNLPQ
jgi:hypothetical protein